MCDENRHPCQQAEYSYQINEILEHGAGIVSAVQECDAGDECADGEGVNGKAVFVGAGKDAVGVAFFSEAVEGPGCDVEIAVCGGEDEDEDACIAEICD